MLGRTSATWKIALAAIALLSPLGCSAPDKRDDGEAAPISESQALAISRDVAERHGYDLSRYELDTFGDRTGGSDKEWLFVYLCSPGPARPGCSFMVVVDRQTGSALVHPGM